MKEHKELEKLVDELFEADTLESPSMGFTNQVIRKVQALQQAKMNFKPLLPRWVFVLMGILTSIFVWVVLKSDTSNIAEPNYFQKIDGSALLSSALNQFNFSSSLGYSLIAVGLILCFQTLLFKRYMNKRLT